MSKKQATWIGIVAMLLLVIGAFLPGGSLTQRVLFVIGAPALGITAMINKQVMFSVLQCIVTVGAILAFCSSLLNEIRYLIMLGMIISAVGWLLSIDYYRHDRTGFIGTLGLILIAIGLATPAMEYPVLFFVSLGFGGLLVAVYSGFSIVKGFQLGWIWLLLNIIFAINPLIQLMRLS